MGFFDTEEGVSEYLEMAKGHDGRELIEKLSDYLPADSTILELGMGPGTDLEILSKRYRSPALTARIYLSTDIERPIRRPA